MPNAIAGYSNQSLVPPHSLSADYANAYNNYAYFGGSFPPDMGMLANSGNPLEETLNQLGGVGGFSGGYGYNYAYQLEQNKTNGRYNERIAELEAKSSGILTGGIIGLGIGTAGATAAHFGVLGAATLLGPVGWLIAGIGLATVGAIALSNYSGHLAKEKAAYEDTRDGIYDGREHGQLMFGLEEEA